MIESRVLMSLTIGKLSITSALLVLFNVFGAELLGAHTYICNYYIFVALQWTLYKISYFS
jgi:hypothetical protein